MLAVALHRQLLEVGGEALEVLLVGQDGDRLRAEEVGVPDAQEPHQHRQVLRERRGAEVFVHLVEAAEHGAEVIRTDRQHRREADRRRPSSSARRPSPRTRTCWRCRCRTSPLPRHWSRRRRSAWRPTSRRRRAPASDHSRAVRALVIVSSVVKVLDETMNSVSAGSRSRAASAKSVPSMFETKRKVRLRSL